jgi:hypothetical protein
VDTFSPLCEDEKNTGEAVPPFPLTFDFIGFQTASLDGFTPSTKTLLPSAGMMAS